MPRMDDIATPARPGAPPNTPHGGAPQATLLNERRFDELVQKLPSEGTPESTPRMTRKSSMSADERKLAIQEALKKDRTARYAKFPANAAWFCQRVTILAALLLVLPLLAGALAMHGQAHAHGSHAAHGAHAGAHSHGEEVHGGGGAHGCSEGRRLEAHNHSSLSAHDDEHVIFGHGHGDHPGSGGNGFFAFVLLPNTVDLEMALAIVVVLVVLTLLFETAKERLEERFEKFSIVFDRIWSELTVLGFLALVTFFMVQSNLLQALSSSVFGDEMHLVHLFEQIHFALFFVLMIFLTLALWLLYAAIGAESVLDAFEVSIRYYTRLTASNKKAELSGGDFTMGRGSMVEASTSASKRELRSTYDDLGRAMCEAELNFAADAYVKRLNGDPLKYEPLVDESGGAGGAPLPKPSGCAPRRLFAPLMRSWWLLLEAQQRSTFQLFRHHFITATVPAKGKGKPKGGGAQPTYELLPLDFDFSDYLLHCTRKLLADTLHFSERTWITALLVMVLIFQLAIFFGPNARVALTVAGWCLWFLSCVAKVHYDWVLEQLLPHGAITRDQQVERLRRPSPYRLVHALLHGISSVFPKPPEARAPTARPARRRRRRRAHRPAAASLVTPDCGASPTASATLPPRPPPLTPRATPHRPRRRPSTRRSLRSKSASARRRRT